MAPDPKIAHVQILRGIWIHTGSNPGSCQVHLLEPRNDYHVRKQDNSSQQCLPIISKFLLAPSASTLWKNTIIMHNILERLITSKQPIILYDNAPIKIWWLVLNRSGEKSHMFDQNKGKKKVEREGNYNLKGKDLSLKGHLQEKITLRCCGAVSKDVFSIMV